MYNATKHMAEAIAEGVAEAGVKYKMFNASTTDESDLLTEIFKAKGVIIGSCTVNNTALRAVLALLEEIKAHKFKGKSGAGFGSYGWSGESAKLISQRLADAGMKVTQEPLMFKYTPTADELRQCVEFGKTFAENMNA
jgi:flavorubredoxin